LVMLDTDDEIAFGLENLEVPREAMRERIAEARAAAGLRPDTPRRLDALSGGAKQRVALASLLAMRPYALVLDEPTANLDPIGAREVVTALAALAIRRERSFLIVEHRLDPLLRFIDRVAVLSDDGRLALAGEPDAVFMGRAADLDRLGVWRPELAELARLLGAQRMLRDVDEAAALLLERWPRAMSTRDVSPGNATLDTLHDGYSVCSHRTPTPRRSRPHRTVATYHRSHRHPVVMVPPLAGKQAPRHQCPQITRQRAKPLLPPPAP